MNHSAADELGAIVAIHGYPGTGKGTLAGHLVRKYGFVQIDFADALYEEVAAALNVDTAALRNREYKSTPQETFCAFHVSHPDYRHFLAKHLRLDLYEPQTGRFHLDTYGTLFMARQGTPLRWVDATMDRIQKTRGPVVVSDLRRYSDLRELRALKLHSALARRELCITEIVREGFGPPNDSDIHAKLPDGQIDVFLDNHWTESEFLAQAERRLVEAGLKLISKPTS
jgi:hypothetical protein